MRTLLCTALLSLSLATPATADLVVVDASGGGDYTDLKLAAGQADDGDVLLVRPGSYNAFEVLPITITGKSLTILADGLGTVTTAPIHVANIGSGQQVVLRGLHIIGAIHTTPMNEDFVLFVQDAAGPVFVEDCIITADSTAGVPGALVMDSGAVSFIDCRITANPGNDAANFPLPWPAGDGGAGLRARGSSVVLYDCTVTGRKGGDEFVGLGPAGAGGAGLRVEGSDVFVSGGTLTGGVGGVNGPPGGGSGGDGISILDAASLVHVLDTVFDPGSGGALGGGGSAADGVAIDDPFGVASTVPGIARRLELSSPIADGGTGQLVVHGEPGDQVLVFASLQLGWQLLPSKGGVFVLMSPWVGPLSLGTITAPGGDLALPFTLPTLGLGAYQVVAQPAFLTTGGPRLGAASALVVVRPAALDP